MSIHDQLAHAQEREAIQREREEGMTEEERAIELDEFRKMLHNAETDQPRNRAERRAWRKHHAHNHEARIKHLSREVAVLERRMLRDYGHV